MKVVYVLTVFPIPFSVFLFNLLRCFRDGKRSPARTAVSAASPVLLLSLILGQQGPPEASVLLLPTAFSVGSFLLLNEPGEEEERAFTEWMAFSVFVAILLLALFFRTPSRMAPAVYGVLFCGQAVYSARRLSLRRNRLREWVQSSSVPGWLDDLRRLSLRFCVLSLALLSILLPSRLWTLVSGLVFALLSWRNWTGRPLLERHRFETEIRELTAVSARRPVLTQGEPVSRELYERCCTLMDERRPFLVEDLSLADLARSLYTNKVYLSRSINYYSGKNFRQFVNYYRVKYAMEQFSANKHLRVSEMAMLSGFHSTVSFNMAFKMVTGETPSDWKRMHLRKARKGGKAP